MNALLLPVFYGIRSERQLMEQLEYNLSYRWFVEHRGIARVTTDFLLNLIAYNLIRISKLVAA